MKYLKYFFLFVDISFILYWTITFFHLIPPSYLYNNYNDPLLVDWNWSFFPLDIFVSLTGFYSIYQYNTKKNWKPVALISLALTFVSGLQAISFWVLRHDYDLTWWIPNLFLLIYPVFFIYKIVKNGRLPTV